MRPAPSKTDVLIRRLRLTIRGAVQGVGFRPFVYRLASEMGLNGWVKNAPQGVFVEVEGLPNALKQFLARLSDEKPPRSFIQSCESSHLDAVGFVNFEIRRSDDNGARSTLVLPDIATCADCLADVLDRTNRRHRYPFTNCTNCGPRYSIIESLPYDRANTTMKSFAMCADCRAEYDDPNDRRFHAQPNACPACGPHLELWDVNRVEISSPDAALTSAADSIRSGMIVAVKGLGGFHLLADARNNETVRRLRKNKRREERPFAVMFPTFAAVNQVCQVSDVERRLLTSPESPIVLLKTSDAASSVVSENVAPNNPYLGVLLPYTPLHHLLTRELGFPVIATSGNLSDEPICIDEHEGVRRLRGITDLFLVHDRPIARHVDDSIVREMMGREIVVRRARGFAPLPVTIRDDVGPTLAVGAHLKNAVAVANGHDVFISQHIGDLETREAFGAFCEVIDSVGGLYNLTPSDVAHDAHPDYASTRWATGRAGKPIAVQHHYAHVLSCMAENEIEPPVLGIAWDGTGYSDDGTIWGGEFLRVTDTDSQRVAHLRTFRLPGGDAAIKEPRRSAIGLLYDVFGSRVFEMSDLLPVTSFIPNELGIIEQALARPINAPLTSSAGRLFDAVASLIGVRQRVGFEGQAAMELEFLADPRETGTYEFATTNGVIDWEPMIRAIIGEARDGRNPKQISARFHNTLVETMVQVAANIGESAVALSGGCFQNKYLTERTITRLRNEGFRVYWHQRVPTNDGGIALGQIIAAGRARRANGLCV